MMAKESAWGKYDAPGELSDRALPGIDEIGVDLGATGPLVPGIGGGSGRSAVRLVTLGLRTRDLRFRN
jgi:hypothetical protein